jgi:hypothetical protein
MAEEKKYNTTLLDVRLVEVVDKKTGKAKKQPKLQLAKDVEIFYKGKKVDMGQYKGAFLKQRSELIDDLNFLLENEYITEERHGEDVEHIDTKQIQLALRMKV